MPTDREKLDDAKRRFLEAKKEIDALREAIAASTCPLKIGDTITVVEDGKEYQGVIEHIHAANRWEELLDPVVGAEPGWAVGGARINKTTGKTGHWSFGINSFDARLVGGKWLVTKRTLNDYLGLSPQPTS
jgi:hypothetical protein